MKHHRSAIGFAVSVVAFLTACDPMMGLDPQTQALIDLGQKLDAQVGTRSAPNAHGAITMSQEGLDPWSGPIDACASGEPRGFPGVDLTSGGPSGVAALRIVVDPIDGPRARLMRFRSGRVESWSLDKSHCTVLEASVSKASIRINSVSVLEGSASLDCVLDDGTSLATTVQFDSCHSNGEAEKVLGLILASEEQQKIDAGAPVPAMVSWPTVPEPVRALKIHPTIHLVGTTASGEPIASARAACLKGTTSLLQKLGFAIAESGSADIEADFGCTGHEMFRESALSFEVLVPKSKAPSVTLRAGSEPIDSLAPGPSALRCDVAGGKSAERTRACTERIGSWADARIANWLAQSKPLLAFAAKKSGRSTNHVK